MILRFASALLACAAVLSLGASPAAAVDNVTVTDTTATADREDNGEFTVAVNVVNNGGSQTLPLPGQALGRQDCTFWLKGDPPLPPESRLTLNLPAQQGVAVKLTLAPACLAAPTNTEVQVDLDGAGGMPPIIVSAPQQVVPPWVALWVGLGGAAVAFGAFWFRAKRIHQHVQKAKVPVAGQKKLDHDQDRDKAYTEVKRLVNGRWDQVRLVNEDLQWIELRDRHYNLADPVEGLEASWSLKDSWMANLTALISAAVAIGSSSQLFTALNEDQPKGPLAVMALAGLIGVALVALANTLVKLIGKPVEEATVRGLSVASATLFAAAVFEILAVTIAAGYAFNVWARFSALPHGKWSEICASLLTLPMWTAVAMIALALVLGFLSWWYLSEKLEHTLVQGVPDSGVPRIAMDEFSTWTLPEPKSGGEDPVRTEKQELLEQRVKTALGLWLNRDHGQALTSIGEPWPGTGTSWGETEWGPGGEMGGSTSTENAQRQHHQQILRSRYLRAALF